MSCAIRSVRWSRAYYTNSIISTDHRESWLAAPFFCAIIQFLLRHYKQQQKSAALICNASSSFFFWHRHIGKLATYAHHNLPCPVVSLLANLA